MALRPANISGLRMPMTMLIASSREILQPTQSKRVGFRMTILVGSSLLGALRPANIAGLRMPMTMLIASSLLGS
jgi:hypothetical protein